MQKLSYVTNILNVPILFMIFNRLDTTKIVFEQIRKAKPPRLYIASDGARKNIPQEKVIVAQVREYVLTHIDWDCEVKILFRDENLGCKYAVSSAITWFFNNEEMGIILEDDTVPSQKFFMFCEELLKKYKNDFRIWHINGVNFQNGWKRDPTLSFYFSYYEHVWGWATWRRAWEYYDVNLTLYEDIKQKGYLFDIYGNEDEMIYRMMVLEQVKLGLNTWDYQWGFARLINNGLCITPNSNLVINIGFDERATHTKNITPEATLLKFENMNFPLTYPQYVVRDKISDNRYFKKYLYQHIKNIKFK